MGLELILRNINCIGSAKRHNMLNHRGMSVLVNMTSRLIN